ncbi:hypothetical protein [Azotobacter salinestris]|uniref:hypothetical protein n=1 Tax=Azotobacter salinestris TaxID=69964 RepID=UPI0032DE4FC8
MLPILLLGCSSESSTISEQIASQFKASNTAPVDLSIVGPVSWERVCILSPYSTNQAAEQILGFKWDAESKTSISVDDGINVLIFIEDQRVVGYAEHPRNMGDFSKLQPRCLVRSQARLKREFGAGNWVYLVSP